MSGTDSKDEREDDTDEARDSGPPEDEAERSEDAEPQRKAKSARSGKLGKKARRAEEARLAKQKAMTTAIVVGVLALAAGGAAGWFGHIEQGKAKIRAESVPAAAGSASGPCGTWMKKICAGSGDQSAACVQAKSATELLTPGTCEVAIEAVPATLAKVKAERVHCDTLIGKLCKDLGPESPTCGLVKDRTPSFPADKCKEMLAKYDEVLGQLRGIMQNGPPMGMAPHGADDGH